MPLHDQHNLTPPTAPPHLIEFPFDLYPRTMETAFAHLGNHLVSDSTSNINAGDDESILDAFPHRRRKDDEETDVFDDDDIETESMASMAVDGQVPKQEEEVELPAHACA